MTINRARGTTVAEVAVGPIAGAAGFRLHSPPMSHDSTRTGLRIERTAEFRALVRAKRAFIIPPPSFHRLLLRAAGAGSATGPT
jgi:hypothetical protein